MNTIIQWNINGFFERLTDIKRIITDQQPIIINLQETNLNNKHQATIKGFTGYFKNRQGAGRASGGVATFANNNFDNKQLNLNTHLEAIAVQTNIGQHSLNICNIYIPDSTPLIYDEIKDIIKQLPKPYIIIGDFNSRNTLWGSNKIDTRGKIMEKILDSEELILLNTGQPTRHNTANGTFSAIDLSFSNTTIAPGIDWQVLNEYNGSDHWPIKIDIPNNNQQNLNIQKWKIKKADWQLFSEITDHLIKETKEEIINKVNNNDIDTAVELLTKTIIQSVA